MAELDPDAKLASLDATLRTLERQRAEGTLSYAMEGYLRRVRADVEALRKRLADDALRKQT